MSHELRPYQDAAVDETFRVWEEHRRALVVMPTGTGKTLVFAKVAERMRRHGRVLVLAHREELIRQACDKIATWTSLSTAVEMGAERADGIFGAAADVVVASVQSLARRARLERFDASAFGLVIVDEAHHAPADTYQRVLDHFATAKVLGVTGTPDRLDGQGLGRIFDTVAFSYELRDAIEDGWLVPIRQHRVDVAVDLSGVRTTAGDLNERDLEREVMSEGALHGVAAPVVRHAADRPTLIFGVTVAHARALAETLAFYADPERVAVLAGDDDREKRRQTLVAFTEGRIQYLVNCALFTEGFDQPSIACVAVARPTKSRALYAQMIGRGTRLAPGKADLLVLDFKGNAGRHALVSTFDVLSGARDDEIERRAQERMNADPEVTILAALREAEEEIATERRRAARVEVRSRLVEIDPFVILGVTAPPGRWGGAAITDKQRDVLERAGIPTTQLDRGQASAVIDKLVERTREGRCTLRQAKTLMRFGHDPDTSFDDARRLLDELAANGWRRLTVTT